jgi:hypothetical protein
MRAAARLLVLCALAGAQESLEHQQQNASGVEALLEVAARFEAVGRINEARARVLQAQELGAAHPAPVLALTRLDAGCIGAECWQM